MCKLFFKVIGKIKFIWNKSQISYEKSKLGFCGNNVKVEWPNKLNNKIFLHDYVNLYGGAKLIIGKNGKFVMKHHSGASQGLTVVTGKHGKELKRWFHDTMWTGDLDIETTVTVCEDARLGVNVTLMPGVTIGRGAQVGACSVVTKDIPPYAIAVGNPAKVIKYIFTPQQIIEHELKLYPKEERFSLEYLQKIQQIK